MFREENEDVISRVLNEREDIELVPIEGYYSQGFLKGTIRAWPHKHGTIGFFYALLKKIQ